MAKLQQDYPGQDALTGLWEGLYGKVRYDPSHFSANADPYTAKLQGLADQYLAAPSGAEAGAQAAAARANAAAMSQAASARGANSALMLREAQANAGQASRQIASDAAAARTQELAGRYTGAAQIAGKAGDLSLGAQDITARSFDAMQRNELEKARAEAEGKKGIYGTGVMALGALSDIRGKEDIRPAGATYFDANPTLSTFDARTGQTGYTGEPDVTFAPPRTIEQYAPEARQDEKPSGLGALLAGMGGGAMMSDQNSKQEIERLRLENDTLLGTLREQRETAKGLPAGTSLKQLVDSYQTRETSKPRAAPTAATAPGPSLEQLAQAYEDQERAKQPQFRADIGEAQIEEPRYQVDVGQAEVEDPRMAMVPSDERGKMSRRMYSDERGKNDLRELLQMATQPAANRENLGEVDPYSYRYKPETAGAIGEDTGRRVGVMAQDVEQAPAGEQVVEETGNGKALDVNRALGFSLAGIAGLDKRLALLEEATGKRRKVA